MRNTVQRKRAGSGALKSEADSVFDRESQHERKRTAILVEAARLFRRNGFAQTSLDDVAAQLGVAKPLIYYYFKSKDHVLAACFERSFDDADEAFEAAKAFKGSGCDRLGVYMTHFLRVHLSEDTLFVAYHETKALNSQLREPIEGRRRMRRDLLRELVSAGVADGSLRPCDPGILISAWAGTVGWIVASYHADGALSVEAFTDEVVSIFLRGVAAPPPN